MESAIITHFIKRALFFLLMAAIAKLANGKTIIYFKQTKFLDQKYNVLFILFQAQFWNTLHQLLLQLANGPTSTAP